MYTIPVSREKTLNDLLNRLKSVKAIVDSAKPCLVSTNEGQSLLDWSPEMVGIAADSGLYGIVSHILLDAANRAESTGALAGELTLKKSVDLSIEGIRRQIAGDHPEIIRQDYHDKADKLSRMIRYSSRAASIKTYQDITNRFIGESKEASLSFDALRLAGANGSVHVFPDPHYEDIVEKVQGYSFDIDTYEEVSKIVKPWDRSNVSIFVIDGIVERVSEIHGLLDESSTSKKPVMIFCRGLSEEVLATILTNLMRETLDVIPIRVPFDENSANLLKDIAVVSGAKYVSSLTGDLISAMTFEDAGLVSRVSLRDRSVSIETDTQRREIASHIQELKQKKLQMTEASQSLIDKRLRALQSSPVRVKLMRLDNMTFKTRLTLVDRCLRLARTCATGGVFAGDGVHFPTGDYPSITGLACIKYSTQSSCDLINIGTAVLGDDI